MLLFEHNIIFEDDFGGIMALVNCPECNKENVSDTSVSCPNCGFNIKQYFETEKRKEKYQKAQLEYRQNEQLQKEQKQKQIDEEYNKYQSEIQKKYAEIDKMEIPKEPNVLAYLFNENNRSKTCIILAIPILSILFAFLLKVEFLIVVFVLSLIVIVPIWLFIEMIGYNEEKSKYEEIANDFNAYKEKQKTIIKNVYRTKAENKVGGDISNIYIPKIQPTNHQNVRCVNQLT